MKRALLVLALVACEREPHGVRYHFPPQQVGTRTTFHKRLDGSIKTPDGVDHGMHEELSLLIQVESMGSNGRADRLRVTVDRHDNVYDGNPKPTLSGTYEATPDGNATRADGKPLGPLEAAFFHTWRDPGADPEAANHEFRTGETFRPTARETDAFGLPKTDTPIAFTVRRATEAEIVLAGDYDDDGQASGVDGHASVIVTLAPTSHSTVGDITLRSNGKDAGAMHVTTEMRRLTR